MKLKKVSSTGVPKQITICRRWMPLAKAEAWIEEEGFPYGDRLILTKEEYAKLARLDFYPKSAAEAKAYKQKYGGRLLTLKPDVWWHPERPDAEPLRFGRRIAIVVSPEQAAYWGPRLPGRVLITVGSGMAFGTGQHETTAMCLRALDSLVSPLQKKFPTPIGCVDIGTGSGVLAIAAAKLGFRPIAAMDNDRIAVRVARENVRANSVKFSLQAADISNWEAAPAPLVFANLYSGLLIKHANRILKCVAPGGALVLSGIREDQEQAVLRAFRKLKLARRRAARKWVCLVLY